MSPTSWRQSVEFEARNLAVVLSIASHKDQIVLKAGCGDQEVKRTGSDPLASAP